MAKSLIKSFILSILNRLMPLKTNEKSFDEIYFSKITKQKIIVFDCGAGEGGSILRFKKVFPNCIIHSFEPLDIFYKKLEQKYKNRKDITINYQGVGNKKNIQTFHKLKKYNGSSFLNPNLNGKWFSRDFSKLSSDAYAHDQKIPEIIEQQIEVNTIDNYLIENKINFIDILKIKTQGSEIKILNGAKSSFSNNKIRFIEVKVILSDIYQEKNSIGNVENCIEPFNFKLIAINHFNSKSSFWIDLLYENCDLN